MIPTWLLRWDLDLVVLSEVERDADLMASRMDAISLSPLPSLALEFSSSHLTSSAVADTSEAVVL